MVTLENTTNCFESFTKAMHYFAAYGFGSQLKKVVQAKVSSGEITIGKPKTFEGESLHVNHEGRYVVTKEVNPC